MDSFTRTCSNYAGVLHLAGWGCEPGAVCCSPGAMMAMDETPMPSTRGVQDPVPFGMGDTVSVENSRARGGRVREVRSSEACGNFTPIGFWRRLGWNGTISICTW